MKYLIYIIAVMVTISITVPAAGLTPIIRHRHALQAVKSGMLILFNTRRAGFPVLSGYLAARKRTGAYLMSILILYVLYFN